MPAPEPPDTLAAALARLRDAEARWRHLVEHAPVVTYVAAFDAIGTLTYVSPQVEALLGHPPEAFLAGQDPERGGLWERLIHPDDRPRVLAATAAAFADESTFECEFRMRAADGRTVHVLERDAVVHDEGGRPAYSQGVLLDVTALREAEAALLAEVADRRRAEEQIAFLAYHDSLTKLPNRALLTSTSRSASPRARRGDRGRAAVRRPRRLQGRQRLARPRGRRRAAAADRACACAAVRATDLLARQGGDEFLILLDRTSPTTRAWRRGGRQAGRGGAAGAVLDRRRGVRDRLLDRHRDLPARRARRRHAAAPRRRRDVRGQGRRARRGSDRLRRGELAPHARAAVARPRRLRRALQRDDFVVHYQPIVRAGDRRAAAFEALVRWQDAERGIVGPNEFIPLAEDTGLIEASAAGSSNAVCAQVRGWRARASTRTSHVNVSPRQLRRARLPDDRREALEAHGVAARRLTLEITESARDARRRARDPSVRELHAPACGSRSTTSARAIRRWRACATCRSRC